MYIYKDYNIYNIYYYIKIIHLFMIVEHMKSLMIHSGHKTGLGLFFVASQDCTG